MNTVINLLSVNWIQFLTTCLCRCKTYRKERHIVLSVVNANANPKWSTFSNIILSSFTLKLRLSKKYVHLKLVADLLALVCLSSLIHDTPQSSPLYSSESYEKATRNEVARISKARVFSFFNSM